MAEIEPELFINGTALTSVPGFYVVSWDGLLATAPHRGDNVPIPGMDGAIGTEKPKDVFTFEIPIVLLGSSKFAQIATLNAISALCPTNLNELVRRVPTDDSGGFEDSWCDGEFLAGLALDTIGPFTGAVSLPFVNLFGDWEPGS